MAISTAAQPRASVVAAYVDGWRRIWRAPAVAIGVLLATWLVTPVVLPVLGGSFFGVVLQESAAVPAPTAWSVQIATHLHSFGFTAEFLAFAGFLAMVTTVASGDSMPIGLFGALAGYVAIWLFLTGGIVDRLARDRRVRSAAFFAACGGLFWRLFRLGLLTGAVYWVLFLWVNPLLRSAPGTQDGVLRGTVLYVIGLVLQAAVALLADFARVRMVVEDRRSGLGALIASIRFLSRRVRVIGLWLLHFAVVAALSGAWYYLATNPSTRSGFDVLVAQLYMLFQIWAKLALTGAQISFFQAELAHATYTASPLPVWPDSPSVEGIENFLQRRNLERT